MNKFENYPFVSVESGERSIHCKKYVYGTVSRLLREALDLVVYDDGKDIGIQTEIQRLDKETEYDPPYDISKLISDDISELSYNDSLSSISSNELILPVNGYNEYLSDDDPKRIMVWDVSGMYDMYKKTKSWNNFLLLVDERNPNVKLCASKFTGVCAKIPSKYNEGIVIPTYEQELEDGKFIDNLMRTSFKKYKVIHSLASWRVRGQIILLKKSYTPKRIRYNLNIKQNAKYHNHEGRVVILEFDSFYLMSLITPGNGWITESIKQRKKWDLELTTFLKASKYIKAVIMVGNLNCCPEDIDVSNPEALRLEKTAVLHEEDQYGYPGTRDVDRKGFQQTLKSGFMNPSLYEKNLNENNLDDKPKFTCIVQNGDKCKCAVRNTLALISSKFLGNIKSCEILGSMSNLNPSGWRHLPIGLTLSKDYYGSVYRNSINSNLNFPYGDLPSLETNEYRPWSIESIKEMKPKDDYIPRHYTLQEIEQFFKIHNENAKKKVKLVSCVENSKFTGENLKSYGFKIKQIQPLRHHRGKIFTFYYLHSLHSDVIARLLNSFHRTVHRFIGGGRATALRIPGMMNECYNVVGLREDYFDLCNNLRNIILRNVPSTATFEKPIIGKFRIKGPMIVVAGHMKFDSDKSIEIINKNQYICTLSPNSYLSLDVKIEYMDRYVMTEYGPESLGRDITDDGFIHFNSQVKPVEIFGFSGERRGLNPDILTEFVTLQLHTDGTITPRMVLIRAASFIRHWINYSLNAFKDFGPDVYGIRDEQNQDIEEYTNPEMQTNVPWNPYRRCRERVMQKAKWFYRNDVIRQYRIDPESKIAKQEQYEKWKKMLESKPDTIMDSIDIHDQIKRNREQFLKEFENVPHWVFQDPLGPGDISQKKIF